MAGPHAPQAGFEAPFETLQADHPQLRRALRLLQRLRLHLAGMGCDAQARQAARELVRYFERDAPAHREDEERHVFPPLLAAGLHVDTVQRLQHEHREMAVLWPPLRALLQRVRGGTQPGLAPADDGLLEHYARLHDWHVATEDELVFPAAAGCLDAAARAAMGQEMARRRRARPPAQAR